MHSLRVNLILIPDGISQGPRNEQCLAACFRRDIKNYPVIKARDKFVKCSRIVAELELHALEIASFKGSEGGQSFFVSERTKDIESNVA